jgi:hypothetical protein
MYKHIGTSFTFETPEGQKVYLSMTPTKPGSCTLRVTIVDETISKREIIHVAGAADLQVQSGTKWAGEQVWAGILEATLNKRKKEHES